MALQHPREELHVVGRAGCPSTRLVTDLLLTHEVPFVYHALWSGGSHQTRDLLWAPFKETWKEVKQWTFPTLLLVDRQGQMVRLVQRPLDYEALPTALNPEPRPGSLGVVEAETARQYVHDGVAFHFLGDSSSS